MLSNKILSIDSCWVYMRDSKIDTLFTAPTKFNSKSRIPPTTDSKSEEDDDEEGKMPTLSQLEKQRLVKSYWTDKMYQCIQQKCYVGFNDPQAKTHVIEAHNYSKSLIFTF